MDMRKIENRKWKIESEYKKDDMWTLQLNMKYVE
jgi:hypothetical protein